MGLETLPNFRSSSLISSPGPLVRLVRVRTKGKRSLDRTQCGFGLFRLRKNHGLRRFQECITEISHRMPRHSTAPPASRRLRRLRFDRRCAKGHRQFAAARVKDRILTVAFNPAGRRTPFAVRFALPCSHLPHLNTTIILYRCGRRTGKSIWSILTTTVVVVNSTAKGAKERVRHQ